MNPSDEQNIIQACQGGDTSRFAELYDAHVRAIYDFIYYKTHHKETAEDLTSETFFKALRSIRQFDQTRSFKTWVYAIARNSVIDHYRKSRPTQDIDDVWDIASDDDIERDVDTKLMLQEVEKHLAKLPQLQRDILILRLWQEMPYREIAEIVGKSEANSKMIYSRTLASLRSSIPPGLFILLATSI